MAHHDMLLHGNRSRTSFNTVARARSLPHLNGNVISVYISSIHVVSKVQRSMIIELHGNINSNIICWGDHIGSKNSLPKHLMMISKKIQIPPRNKSLFFVS